MDDVQRKAEELMGAKGRQPAPMPQEPSPKEREEIKKQIDQLMGKLETFKKAALKKFPFLTSISLIPPEASQIFEEEGMRKEKDKDIKFMHLYITMPDDKAKEYPKVKMWMIKETQEIKPKIWVHLALTKDLWELGYDGNHESIDAIAASMPIHDKGILGALRVANIHKIMCLRKFEKYIVSYAMVGSLVRGEATKVSDVDILIIIDDTDVKKLTRAELRDKLRGMIYGYAIDAGDISGVTNKLSPQIHLLTDFWDGVREANPIFFTFIRDGVPLYDRGTFMPWKLLLKMGKITGTSEAIERFLTQGEEVPKMIKRKLLDIATNDIYWSVITPSQAALMLYGLAPPTPKETLALMKKVFFEEEKLLEKKYIDFLEHVVIDIYKQYEYEKLKEVSGKEIDELLKGSAEYLDRIKKLVEDVGKRKDEKIIVWIYDDLVKMLSGILGEGNEKQLLERFESELVAKGKMPPKMLYDLEQIFKAKKRYSEKKPERLTRVEVERMRKDGQNLIALINEYAQRGKILEQERVRFLVSIDGKEGDLYVFQGRAFLIKDLNNPDEVMAINLEKGTMSKSSSEELAEAHKKPSKIKLTSSLFDRIEKIVGKKMEIMF